MVEKRLPSRFFSPGHEPKECRATGYPRFWMIDVIAKALPPRELAMLKRSPFGMLLNLPSMSNYGSRFAHYLLCNQLATKKKHELWFVFGGKPWRFSLKEFAIVTGLCCGKLPKKKKKKDHNNNNPQGSYWSTLFGDEKNVTVNWIVDRFQNGKVEDSELRIRYACLFLAQEVLFPTSDAFLISKESVELVRDVDEFLAYPWGRLSFDMVLRSVKAKTVNTLLGNKSVAIQGFAYALQLVALKAIPAMRSIRLHDVLEIEKSATDVQVVPLIEGDLPNEEEEEELCWSDEEEDEDVDNLMELVAKNHSFSHHVWDVQSPVAVITPSLRPPSKRLSARNAEKLVEVQVDYGKPAKGDAEKLVDVQVTYEEAEWCKRGLTNESNTQRDSDCENRIESMVSQAVQSKISDLEAKLEAKLEELMAERKTKGKETARAQQQHTTCKINNGSESNESEKMWHYKDQSGKVQGPFSIAQLCKRNNSWSFPAKLEIWKASLDSVLLSDALSGLFHHSVNHSAALPSPTPAGRKRSLGSMQTDTTDQRYSEAKRRNISDANTSIDGVDTDGNSKIRKEQSIAIEDPSNLDPALRSNNMSYTLMPDLTSFEFPSQETYRYCRSSVAVKPSKHEAAKPKDRRVTIHLKSRSKDLSKLIILPDSIEELLRLAGDKSGDRSFTTVTNAENAEIDDVDVIRDGDHLFFFHQ